MTDPIATTPTTTTTTAAGGSCYRSVRDATTDDPWTIGVIGAMPQRALTAIATTTSGGMTRNDAATTVRCVRDGNWSALWRRDDDGTTVADNDGTTAPESSSVVVAHVSYAHPQHGMERQKFETPVTDVPLSSDDDDDDTMFLALRHQRVHGGGGTAFLYVIRPRGHVAAYAVNGTPSSSRRGNVNTPPPSPPIRGTLPSSDDDDDFVTAVTADRDDDDAVVCVGTARGRVWRVHARAATHTLRCHEVTRDLRDSTHNGRGGGGLLKGLFSAGDGTTARRRRDARWKFPRIRSIAAGTGGSFWTVSCGRDATCTDAELRHWRPTPRHHHDATTTTPRSALRAEYSASAPLDDDDVVVPADLVIHSVAQARDDALHVLGRTITKPDTRRGHHDGDVDDDVRWYAVRWSRNGSADDDDDDDHWHVAAVTWLNRLSASAVCRGWEATSNGMVYGAFQPQSNASSIILAVAPQTISTSQQQQQQDDDDDDEDDEPVVTTDRVYEYDCDHEDDILPGSFQADYATHGVTFGYHSGVWIRAQAKVAVAASHRTSLSTTSGSNSGAARRRHQWTTLRAHLKSTLDTYMRTSHSVELPPSWRTPEAATVRDQVVAQLGLEHLPHGGCAPSVHRTYVDFLQQVGLYRSLQAITKWHLLAMGQEIAAHQALMTTTGEPEHSLLGLQQSNLAVWLEQYQSKFVLPRVDDPTKMTAWLRMLATCLDAAMRFRSERATFPYDLGPVPPVVQKPEEVPLWLSRPAVQRMLRLLVEYHVNLQQQQQQDASAVYVPNKELETILLAAMESHAASFQALPGNAQVRAEYARMQAMVMQLLMPESPDLAWSLSQEHLHFDGLCTLAKRFEKEPDTPFALEPLFKVLGSKQDVETGLTFGCFVLKWHVDRGLHGHALDYGNHCPTDLKQIVDTDPSFGQFRWIVALRNGNLEEATKSLIDNTTKESATVGQAKVNMAFAKIANGLVPTAHDLEAVRGASEMRQRTIERLRERANAQEELYGDTVESRGRVLRSPQELLNYALTQLDTKDTVPDRVQTCFRALAVCNTFETARETLSGATRVWLGALQTDLRIIQTFITQSSRIDVQAVTERTVLGRLYDEVSDDPDFAKVKLTSEVCEGMLGKLESDDHAGVSRLLRSLMTADK